MIDCSRSDKPSRILALPRYVTSFQRLLCRLSTHFCLLHSVFDIAVHAGAHEHRGISIDVKDNIRSYSIDYTYD